MTRQYSSFIIRRWRLDGDEQRIKIEDILSGEHVVTTSLDAMLAWIEAHDGGSADDPQQSESTSVPQRGDVENVEREGRRPIGLAEKGGL
jgi:hypothetical protein